ncbi:hypothetical protein ACPOLB_09235 [Rubrivivax sp. RP6-9]|uniref:hypothetical protein n=1 Tax=Rubrivivax sp. RP6-9 TaxID=3415750 RepID=UPI003CC69AFF
MLDQRRQALRGSIDAAARSTPGAAHLPVRVDAVAALVRARCADFPHAGRWLALDLDAAAAALGDDLAAGLRCDEALAATLLSAAVAMGAAWHADWRLCGHGAPPAASLLVLSRQPGGGLQARLDAAMLAAEALHGVGLAAWKAWQAAPDAPRAGRGLRRAVFGRDAARADAFIAAETALLDAAGLDGAPLRALCIAADMAFGHGRCVRIAQRAQAAGRAPLNEVTEACHGLVQDADL